MFYPLKIVLLSYQNNIHIEKSDEHNEWLETITATIVVYIVSDLFINAYCNMLLHFFFLVVEREYVTKKFIIL